MNRAQAHVHGEAHGNLVQPNPSNLSQHSVVSDDARSLKVQLHGVGFSAGPLGLMPMKG